MILSFNTIIDHKLVKLIRRDLAIKKINIEITTTSTKKKKLEEIQTAQANANKLIIYTFLIYMLCRLPELAFYVFLLFLKSDDVFSLSFTSICQTSICYLARNCIQYLYMLSYTTNIFFYYKFNKPFRFGLKLLFKSKKKVNS